MSPSRQDTWDGTRLTRTKVKQNIGNANSAKFRDDLYCLRDKNGKMQITGVSLRTGQERWTISSTSKGYKNRWKLDMSQGSLEKTSTSLNAKHLFPFLINGFQSGQADLHKSISHARNIQRLYILQAVSIENSCSSSPFPPLPTESEHPPHRTLHCDVHPHGWPWVVE